MCTGGHLFYWLALPCGKSVIRRARSQPVPIYARTDEETSYAE